MLDASLLRQGTEIRFGGVHCVVGAIADDAVVLHDRLGKHWRAVPRDEFDTSLDKRRVKVFFRDSSGRVDHRLTWEGAVIEFMPDLVRSAQWKEKIVRFLLEHHDGQCSPATVGEAYAMVRPPASVLAVRDPRTVRRWVARYREWADVRALIDRHIDKGPREARLHPKIREMIETAIDERYLRRENTTIGRVIGNLKRRIAEANAKRSGSAMLVPPSDETIRRAIRQRDPYFIAVARDGRKAADAAFAPIFSMAPAKRPGDVVMMDFAVIDLMLIIDGEAHLCRLWLCIAIDAYSRRILAFHVSQTPDTQAALDCLRKAVQTAKLKPQKLLMDNGSAFVSERFQAVCGELGIIPEYCEVDTPYHKGIMERVFRTLNQGLIHQIPGTTFGSVRRRGDYDPIARALVHQSEFEAALRAFIDDVYDLEFHRGLGGIPAEVWARGMREHRDLLPCLDDDRLCSATGHEERRRVSAGRIRVDNLHYGAADIDVLREVVGDILCRRIPEDRSRLWAYDKLRNRWVKLHCVETVDPTGAAELAARRSLSGQAAALRNSGDRRIRQDEILSALDGGGAPPRKVAKPGWRRGDGTPPGVAVEALRAATPPSPAGFDDIHADGEVPDPSPTGFGGGVARAAVSDDRPRRKGGAGARDQNGRRSGSGHDDGISAGRADRRIPLADQDPGFDPFDVGEDEDLDAWAHANYPRGRSDPTARNPGDAEEGGSDGDG